MKELKDLIIGLEINSDFSQITYYGRKENDAISIPVKAGTEQYMFPTVLCRLFNKNDWKFGSEAEYFIEHRNGVEVRNLYNIWCSEEPYRILNDDVEPGELLAIYISRILDFLGVKNVLKNVKGIAVSVPEVTYRFAQNMKKAFRILGFDASNSFLMNSNESFYYFCMYHGAQATKKSTGLFMINEGGIEFRKLSIDHTKIPAAAAVSNVRKILLEYDDPEYSARFYDFTLEVLRESEFGYLYIIQKDFNRERAERAVRLMCEDNRRVFAGDNINAKGACFAAFDRVESKRLKHVFFDGDDVLKKNVGMMITISDRQVYYPFAKAGSDYYEAGDEITLLIRSDGNSFNIITSSVNDKYKRNHKCVLDGIDEREPGTTRIRLNVGFISEDLCVVNVEDLGFGGIVPKSGKKWNFDIRLDERNDAPEEFEGKDTGEHFRLCLGGHARNPYYVNSIGLSLWSLDELSFFFVKYPELCDEEILNRELTNWIEDEIGKPDLARNLRLVMENDNRLSSVIGPVISEAGYLPMKELVALKQRMAEYERKPMALRTKEKGDVLVSCGKYTAAMNAYRKAAKEAAVDPNAKKLMPSLYHNIGVICMRLLMYEKSLEYFKKAYDELHTREALLVYITACAISLPRSRYEEILKKMHISEEMIKETDQKIRNEINYQVPSENKIPEEIIKDLVGEYIDSSGMPEY